MDTKSIVLNVVGATLALALVALTFVNTIALLAAVALALGLFLLVYLGPERLGLALVGIGVYLTPQNELRPLTAPSFAWSDIALVLGFGLLLPRLLRTRTRVPSLFAAGALGVVVMSIASSLVAPDPGESAYWSGFFLAAAVALPLLFCLLRPSRAEMLWLCGLFVAGQSVSALYDVAASPGEWTRSVGLTYQPNFYAIGGLMSMVICTFLYQAARPGIYRWIVLGAGGLGFLSVYSSGSRGVLLGVFAIVLVYPLIERSALSAYLLVSMTLGAVPLLGLIASSVSESSALGRLLGKDPTAAGSNDQRRDSLAEGWDRFMGSPILGSGFENNLGYHNILLQVPVAIGVLGFAAWLALIASFIFPLFGTGPYRRLGYVPLAYLAVGLTEPLLFDRVGWIPMSLALVAAITPAAEPEPSEDEATAAAEPAGPSHR